MRGHPSFKTAFFFLNHALLYFHVHNPHQGPVEISPLTDWVIGGTGGMIQRRQGCPLLDIVHQAFLLSTVVVPTLQGALKDGFGEAVVQCDMSEP